MTNNVWKACILGDEKFLVDLTKVFVGPDCLVRKGGDGFTVEGAMFVGCDSEEACRAIITPWIESINGAIEILGSSAQPVTLGYVVNIDPQGKVKYFMNFRASIVQMADSVSVTITKANGTVEEYFPAQAVPRILARSASNPTVARTLRLLAARDRSWVQLYRIFEIIRDDMGGNNSLVNAGWITKETQDRFTRSANHPDVSGDQSRHGVNKVTAPPKPMTNGEAASVIMAIVHQWLEK